MRVVSPVLIVLWAAGCSNPISSFDLDCSVSNDRLFNGGPGRDGIPALDFPLTLLPEDADYLSDTMRVLGLEIAGEARAYPLLLLWWHEVVNDSLGGVPVLVSYCPFTGSGLAFDRRIGGDPRRFGVSGLLFENNLMMFDRQTESLWGQLLLGGTCGPEQGTPLARLPIVETTWREWRTLHPNTTVLRKETGFDRPYGRYPYGAYALPDNPVTLFPSAEWSNERPPKERVLGVRHNDDAVAYPFGVLEKAGEIVSLNDEAAERPILVTYVAADRAARAFDRTLDGRPLTFTVIDTSAALLTDAETGSVWNTLGEAVEGPLAGARLRPLEDAWTVFWFSWSVFYPRTRVYLGE